MNPIPEGMVALLVGVPYVVSVRGEVAKGLSTRLTFLERPFSWLERLVLRHARKVLANGSDTQRRLAGASIASSLVPNGVDFKRFSEPAPASGPNPRAFGSSRPLRVTSHLRWPPTASEDHR